MGQRLLAVSKRAEQLPDYEGVIPQEWNFKARVDRAELLEKVRQVNVFSTGEFRPADLEIGSEQIRVVVKPSTHGKAEQTIRCLEADGNPLALRISLRHLLDFAGAFDCEYATVAFTSPTEPFMLRPVADEDHFCVGMPLD